MKALACLSLIVTLSGMGCSQDRCAPVGVAAAGAGVASGGARLCLGDSLSQVRTACDPVRVYDLGAVGLQVVCPDQHVAAHLDSATDPATVTAVTLYPEAQARTPEGIGPGSTRAAVESAYGPPGFIEPYQRSYRYPGRGLTFNFVDDQVVSAQVFIPAH